MQTLLVVDDSRVDRRLVGGLLQKTGEYEVIYAENGRDALQRLELDIPDAGTYRSPHAGAERSGTRSGDQE